MANTQTVAGIAGEVYRRGDAGYEAARLDAVWNERRPERYPDVIVVCASENDVVEAVRYAVREDLKVSIRSGGHSWVGNGVRDGGLLIDIHNLTDVSIDVAHKIASVQPAAKGPQIQQLLVEKDLFFPTGHAPTVGIGGFIIGGGYGWNSRAMGPACLSIIAIDVVLADGTLVHATDETHPDLMWAVRGSGPGFFGVVTRFYLKLHDRPTKILRTVLTFSIELRDEVMAWGNDNLESIAREIEISAKVGHIPGSDQEVVSLTTTAFCTPETGENILEPIAQMPYRSQAIKEIINQEVTIFELYDIADALNPPGKRWAVDGIWSDASSAEVLSAAAPLFDNIPSGASFVLWMIWGSYPEQSNACWSSQGHVYLSPNSGWDDAADDLAHEQWVHGELAKLQHLSVGLQFSDNNVADRPDDGIVPENMKRLEEIRVAYDPTGLFRSYMTLDESATAYGKSLRAK